MGSTPDGAEVAERTYLNLDTGEEALGEVPSADLRGEALHDRRTDDRLLLVGSAIGEPPQQDATEIKQETITEAAHDLDPFHALALGARFTQNEINE